MTKVISLLGSTGSIGRQTLQVARELGLGVAALTANRQVDLLEQQVREFRPELAVLYDCEAARAIGCRPILVSFGHQDRSRLKASGATVIDRFEELYPTVFEKDQREKGDGVDGQ